MDDFFKQAAEEYLNALSRKTVGIALASALKSGCDS